jgi:hypothetical protein
MKYQVQISYTNPSHEHVTLRRRVETITRLVEASTEGEALNRAANQQRALGFKIQEAKVLQPLQPTSLNEEVEQVDEADVKSKPVLHKGKAIGETGIDTKTYRSPGQGEWYAIHHKSDMNTLGFHSREEAEAEVRAAHKIFGSVKEEAEQVDEANMRFDPEAAATPKSRDVQNFRMKDTNRRAGAASKKYIRRMTKLGGLGPNQTKKDTEAHMKANFGEEVGADKRDAGYKMSPAVRKAQAESDRLSKVVKPVQAGTLAAQRRRAEMKKEEVESVDEGVISAVKNAQAKWKTAHRAVYGKDPSLKSMTVGAIARLAGAKASTARAVGAAVGGKSVSAQQQAAAKARAGKVGMAKMRNEEKHEGDDVNANVKGKKAAEKMTKKAAEVRKAKIQGSVNKINMEPTIDLNKKAEK